MSTFTPPAHNSNAAMDAKKLNSDQSPAFNINFEARTPTKTVINRLQPEGVGVSVLRSIGSNPRYYNPFALLDNFLFDRNSVEEDRGFSPHPHRGISTLTFMLEGHIEHEDHKGNKGQLGPGDVQFMSAGKGIVHSEMPITNNPITGLQLWINLPKNQKMTEPHYQEYKSHELPEIKQGGVWAKIIAGKALGFDAPIKTNTPVHYIYYKLDPGHFVQHQVPTTWNSFIYTLTGKGFVGPDATQMKNTAIAKHHTIFFDAAPPANNSNDEVGITVQAAADEALEFVLISGQPLDEPESEVIQYGPMIMNNREQIQQAFYDYRTSSNGFEGADAFQRRWIKPTAYKDDAQIQ